MAGADASLRRGEEEGGGRQGARPGARTAAGAAGSAGDHGAPLAPKREGPSERCGVVPRSDQ
eukprot:3674020-Prymnesium_polylepis.1